MKISIGIFVEGLSLPAKEGIAKHCVELACFLASQSGFEPVLIAVDRGRASLDALGRLPLDTYLVPESVYYDPSQVRRIIKECGFDVVQNYNPHYFASILAPAARAVNVPCIYEMHDLEADLGFMNDNSNITDTNVKMQRSALLAATISRVMSAYDYDSIKDEGAHRLKWIPVGMERQYIRRDPMKGRILFIGNTSYPPNRESCEYIINELAPRFPEKEFHLIGRETDTLLGGENVVTHGEVADLTPWLATAECGIAPTLQGSGMKIKLLTYLSAGVPCVATTVATAGYPTSGAIKVADTPEAFGEAFKRLASEDEVADYFKTNFDIQTLADQIRLLYETAAKTPYSWPQVETRPFDMSQLHWLKEGANQAFLPCTAGETHVRGRRPLVVFEGLPGAGKTSLIEYLTTEFAGGAKRIDEVVIDISMDTEDSYRKNDMTKSALSRAIGNARFSIMDRDYVSNLAFAYAMSKTTGDKAMYESACKWCEAALQKGVLREPDLYVILKVTPQLSVQRRSAVSGAWGDLKFAQAADEFYTHYFSQLPDHKLYRIDTDYPFAEVAEQVKNRLADFR